MTFTIKKINKDGSIDVSFSVDKKMQNISGFPIDDAEALQSALGDYEIAYMAGLEIVTPVISDDVTALVGKTLTAPVDESAV